MKKVKISVLLLSGAILLGSCSTMNNTATGGVIGGGSGAAAGAIIGGLIGKGKGAAIGAAVGGAVGAGTGALIGKAFGRGDKSKYGESDDSGLRGDNLATKDGGGSSGGH